jgi:hypothetical protein
VFNKESIGLDKCRLFYSLSLVGSIFCQQLLVQENLVRRVMAEQAKAYKVKIETTYNRFARTLKKQNRVHIRREAKTYI